MIAAQRSRSVGVAIGLLTSRLVIRRAGYALLATLLLSAVFVLVPGVPPVHPLVTLLIRGASATGGVLRAAAVDTVVAVALLAASATATQFVAARRD